VKDHRPDHRLETIAYRPSTITTLVIVLTAVAVSAQVTDRTMTESQSRRASERLLALQREADALASEQRTLLVDLRRLEVERNLKAEQLRHIEADVQQVARDLGNAGNEIDALEAETAAARPALEARMVELYKLGGAGYTRLVLNVPDVKDFGRAFRMVAALATRNRVRF
jgi:septal ring factor EnvC (AmiA/AmiB activator)